MPDPTALPPLAALAFAALTGPLVAALAVDDDAPPTVADYTPAGEPTDLRAAIYAALCRRRDRYRRRSEEAALAGDRAVAWLTARAMTEAMHLVMEAGRG